MKRILPIFFAFIFVFASLFPQGKAFAQTPTPGGQQLQQNGQVPAGSWVIDKEVTFIGKNAARSGNLLDFTLRNYNWVCVTQNANGQCDDSNNPLAAVWLTTVQFIVAPLLFIVIIATSIIVIVTRGRSLTITRFIPRFIAVLLLIFLSFGILRFFYIFTDVIQGFFLRPPDSALSCPPECISQNDLLFVGWDYENFIGLRLLGGTGEQNAEAAFITLLLTKLTALTYFVMVGILFLRKIILWLFIIVAPIFPLLLLFYPIRNTGKIWIGEFFRWLLYAPLFAIFLKGLVSLWRDKIPLFFGNPDIGVAGKEIYPTAVNILLGGPKEFVTPTNSVNLTETFALYVVSLIMLWGVIILPWILLQIFLDYASNMGVGDSMMMKTLVSKISNLNPPGGSPAHPPSSDGAALNLPFAKKFSLPINPSAAPTGSAKAIPMPTSVSNVNATSYMPSAQVKAQTLSLTNLSIPSLRDIAKYDTSLISKDSDRQKETTIIQKNLEKIGNPASSSSSTERERYTEIREKLTQESKSGNSLATSILSAASTISSKSTRANTSQIKSILSQIANPALATASASRSTTSSASTSATSSVATSVVNHEKLSKMNESLVKARKEGNSLAASILSVNTKTSDAEIEKLQERIMDAKAKGEPIAAQIAGITKSETVTKLPVVNRVQTVSKEDYQAVKDMWKENYKNLEVPEGMSGTRVDWVKEDMSKIESIIALLNSKDAEQVNKGMDQVASILPFLLVGGFSQAEITAYLSAKLEAARDIAAEIVQDDEEKVSVTVKKTATATQTMSASVPEDSDSDSDLSSLPSSGSIAQTLPVSNEILSMANLQIPKLTDIVQYEVRHLTKDKKESERIEKIHEVLEKLGNPGSTPLATERAQYETLKNKLSEESLKGNATADVILSAVSQLTQVAGHLDATLVDIKQVLLQIVNASNASQVDDRDYYTRLHEYLEKESKEKNNTLAGKILSVNDKTGFSEIQAIKDQLAQSAKESSTTALPQLAGAVSDYSRTQQLRTVVKQILMPADALPKVERNKLTKIHDSLTQESAKGNTLATNLLSVSDKTSVTALKQLQDKLVEAGKAGDPIASSIIAQTSIPASFSSAKRMQEVTPQEYEEVRSLWQKAYKQYLVPSQYTEDVKGRSEWISNDVKDIEETVNMLNSPDADTKNKGIEKVSSILPFLLLGGYSFNEINSYLKIKLEAANYALKDLQQEEESQVSIDIKKNISVPQELSASVPDESGSKGEENSSLQSAQQSTINSQTANELLSIANIKLPTMSDIARYESLSVSKDKSKTTEVEKMQESLEKITNPSVITTDSERDKFQKLQERLIEESQKQNAVATSILSAATTVSQNTLNVSADQIKNVFSKVVNPASADSEGERKRFEELRNMLDKDARENNNKLAATILAINEKTTIPEMEKIREDIKKSQIDGSRFANNIIWTLNKSILGVQVIEKAKKVFTQIANPTLVTDPIARNKFAKAHDVLLKASLSGSPLANSILSVSDKSTTIEVDRILGEVNTGKNNNDPVALEVSGLIGFPIPAALPSVNKVQTVEQKDYESVKQIWKESYKNLDIPEGTEANRVDWVKKDIANIDVITNQLNSQDKEEVEKGMNEVSNILPFILVGGFSQGEIIAYLKAKQDAAKETLDALSKDEEEKVDVSAKKDEESKEMSAKEEIPDTEKRNS